MEQVVYFSLDKEHRTKFYKTINKLRYTPKLSFGVVGVQEFKNLRDLIPLIDECKNRDSLHVIVDYKSINDINDGAEVMRHIIMAYPEVQFLFDETESVSESFLDNFLFVDILDKINDDNYIVRVAHDATVGWIITQEYYKEGRKKDLAIRVQSALHTIRINDDQQCALLLVKGRNNLFDASNLRSAIKAVKRSELKVRDNFQKLTDSRRNNEAIVVEEESHQNMFNSYCLYANGYRVFPITTATELMEMNANAKKKTSRTTVSKGRLVMRDYDLQFMDESEAGISEYSYTDVATKKNVILCKTDFVRGAKKDKDDGSFLLIEELAKKYGITDQCWCSFKADNIFFVSKGGDGLKIRLKRNACLQKKQKHMKAKGKKLILRGEDKPMEGIYKSFQRIREVEERYKATRYRSYEVDYKIVIKRQEKDGHSCPLDIYGIARSMVQRAEKYYSDKKYRLAALVAGESIEILNGFHPSLMKRAYYVQAVSENAMAMSLLGGEEPKLVDDINFRCRKIKEDISRIVPNRKDRTNMLNSIYNDCRMFCQEVEYLDAADEVLSFFVHENERLF